MNKMTSCLLTCISPTIISIILPTILISAAYFLLHRRKALVISASRPPALPKITALEDGIEPLALRFS